MNTPDKALFALLVLFCAGLGLLLIGYLIYFVWFILELALKTHWITIPIGIIAMVFLILQALAMQSK